MKRLLFIPVLVLLAKCQIAAGYSTTGREQYRDPKLAARLSLILLGIFVGFVSCHNNLQPNTKEEEGSVSINLSTVTHSDQGQMFSEVKRTGFLPKAVLDQFKGGIADPGQPFNSTDVLDPKLPIRLLVVAGVSKQYCIVSYWQGGRALTLKTTVFEVSDGKAKAIWISDSQGGLNFRDLKEIVESGRMHNDLGTASW
jgi:hypothetical protein